MLISHDDDQYSTDFAKAVKWVRVLQGSFTTPDELVKHRHARSPNPLGTIVEFDDVTKDLYVARAASQSDVIVFGGLGGRVDQGIGLLSEFAREGQRHEGLMRFWLISERSVSWVLDPRMSEDAPGRHVIRLSAPDGSVASETTGLFSLNVGILPVFGPANITTKGLEWDVEDWPTSMGAQVSTSNHVVSSDGVVEVENTAAVLFTVELGPQLVEAEGDGVDRVII